VKFRRFVYLDFRVFSKKAFEQLVLLSIVGGAIFFSLKFFLRQYVLHKHKFFLLYTSIPTKSQIK